MTRTIRRHLRDFLALLALVVIGTATTLVILSQQQAALPSWLPFLGKDFFELEARLSTGQALTPGQGQAVDIAGIQVGKLGSVELEDGDAVVRLDIEPKYADLIHSDATLLLRPKTGLNDMVLEIDPGTTGPPVEEGDLIPLASTQPNVQPDEILATLDADSRDFLNLLLAGGAEGLGGHGRRLSAGLRRLEPTARDLARIGTALSARRHNLSRVIHNFRLVAEELGNNDAVLADFVESSNAALVAFADQQRALRDSIRELPPTLGATRSALSAADELSLELRPTLRELLPGARALAPALRGAQSLFRQTTAPIGDQIRPFTRQVRPTVLHAVQGAEPLARTLSGLAGSFADINRLLNELAYNPPGPAREGFLFWLAWLNHNTNGIFLNQDAGGPLRRGIVLLTCSATTISKAVAAQRPFLNTVYEATGVPTQEEICPGAPPAVPPAVPPAGG
jgi:phospholipid/cholesterol/gamma-HCH transport system substrate-binding protein